MAALTYLLMELSASWEAANCAATQELSSILWNPKVHYRLHKSPPLVPILSQIDPIPTIPHYVVFFNLPSLHLSLVQIFSSTPCSQTPSVYAPSLMSKTKFHTHTEPSVSTGFAKHIMPILRIFCYGPHRKYRSHELFYCWVRIRCRGSVFAELLPSNGCLFCLRYSHFKPPC
jgi:hypothetical protein